MQLGFACAKLFFVPCVRRLQLLNCNCQRFRWERFEREIGAPPDFDFSLRCFCVANVLVVVCVFVVCRSHRVGAMRRRDRNDAHTLTRTTSTQTQSIVKLVKGNADIERSVQITKTERKKNARKRKRNARRERETTVHRGEEKTMCVASFLIRQIDGDATGNEWRRQRMDSSISEMVLRISNVGASECKETMNFARARNILAERMVGTFGKIQIVTIAAMHSPTSVYWWLELIRQTSQRPHRMRAQGQRNLFSQTESRTGACEVWL